MPGFAGVTVAIRRVEWGLAAGEAPLHGYARGASESRVTHRAQWRAGAAHLVASPAPRGSPPPA
jgi:hypothetical protein